MSTDATVRAAPAPAAPHSWWWIVVGAGLLSCVYLPTLNMPFDFIDDGNLVYPAGPMPLERRRTRLAKDRSQLSRSGPFRPTLWAHGR